MRGERGEGEERHDARMGMHAIAIVAIVATAIQIRTGSSSS